MSPTTVKFLAESSRIAARSGDTDLSIELLELAMRGRAGRPEALAPVTTIPVSREFRLVLVVDGSVGATQLAKALASQGLTLLPGGDGKPLRVSPIPEYLRARVSA